MSAIFLVFCCPVAFAAAFTSSPCRRLSSATTLSIATTSDGGGSRHARRRVQSVKQNVTARDEPSLPTALDAVEHVVVGLG